MIKRSCLRALAAVCLGVSSAGAQSAARTPANTAVIPKLTDAQQMAAAVLPLPASMQSGAGVVEFSKDGATYRTLKQSTNGFVCMGPHGGEPLFNAQCFHPAMFPLWVRLIALGAQGVRGDSADRQIESEIKAGQMKLPGRPVASYLMRGPAAGYDAATGHVTSDVGTWQTIEAPHETGATLGLPEKAAAGGTMPYVMQGGTLWAHIMVVQR